MNHSKKTLGESKEIPNSWCPLPWSHISIKGNGTYRLCCHSNTSKNRGILTDTQGVPLHIDRANWKDVINSETMKSVRKNMLAGKWSPECQRCQREFNSGMVARNFKERDILANTVESEIYPSYPKAQTLTQSDGSILLTDFPISFPDIRFGNLCNLRCAMCSPVDSSAWYKEYHTIFGNHIDRSKENIVFVQNSNGGVKTQEDVFNWSESPKFWSQIEKYIHQFRRIYIAGGEPLLINDYYKFLRKCIQKNVAKKLTIEMNSNITYIPKKVWSLWKEFKRVHIGISLDGFGKVNDFIRYPSKWNLIEKQLLQFNERSANLTCYITTSVSVLNIWHLPLFLEYLMKKNYKCIGLEETPLINPHPVHRSYFLNINVLEESFKEKIKEHFKIYKEKISNFDWQSAYGNSQQFSWEKKINRACKIMDNYVEFMYQVSCQKEKLVKWRSDFIYFMDKLDELRGVCWENTFPELYESTLEWRKLQQFRK